MTSIYPHDFLNTNALKSPKSKTDITHAQVSRLIASSATKEKIDIAKFPIYYQGKIGSCIAHAITWIKMYQDYLESGEIRDYSPRFLYALTKAADNLPKDCEGTYPSVAIAQLHEYGVCDQSFFPNDVSVSFQEYKDKSKITKEAFANALPRWAGNKIIINHRNWEDICSAIDTYGPVACLIGVGKELWTAKDGTTSWKESDVLPLRVPDVQISGHEIALYDYDDKYIYFVNSFSKDWGRNGIGYFGKEYLPFVFEVLAFKDLPDNVMTELLRKKSILEQLVEAYKKLLELKGRIQNK